MIITPVPGPVGDLSSSSSLTTIHLYWHSPVFPNGVIIAYEVSYKPPDDSEPETSLNTTNTSFSTPDKLEEGTKFLFAVRAYTRVGPGNASFVTVSTLTEQCKQHS